MKSSNDIFNITGRDGENGSGPTGTRTKIFFSPGPGPKKAGAAGKQKFRRTDFDTRLLAAEGEGGGGSEGGETRCGCG
jgi:hypothetical protein